MPTKAQKKQPQKSSDKDKLVLEDCIRGQLSYALQSAAIQIGLLHEHSWRPNDGCDKAWHAAKTRLDEWMSANHLIRAFAEENKEFMTIDEEKGWKGWIEEEQQQEPKGEWWLQGRRGRWVASRGLLAFHYSCVPSKLPSDEPAFVALFTAFQYEMADIIEPWLNPLLHLVKEATFDRFVWDNRSAKRFIKYVRTHYAPMKRRKTLL